MVDFMSDDEGNAKLTLALGYYQGGMANGGRSTGTGYFDMFAYEKFHDGKMTDYIPTDEELQASFAKLPQL